MVLLLSQCIYCLVCIQFLVVYCLCYCYVWIAFFLDYLLTLSTPPCIHCNMNSVLLLLNCNIQFSWVCIAWSEITFSIKGRYLPPKLFSMGIFTYTRVIFLITLYKKICIYVVFHVKYLHVTSYFTKETAIHCYHKHFISINKSHVYTAKVEQKLHLTWHLHLFSLFTLLKGIVQPKMNIWCLSAYPKGIQDVGDFVSSVEHKQFFF